ncbi:LysR family transcriptional regulator [Pseudomonas sp. gcc21]|uniref:LysR substrate-binding domain-containing protein n=1 Tax=Pseudomonas sp. gcc21 TaxID=2726989 RepID=UPI0014524DD4|nr:LysR substrate-binding domain-containing protein [Pseudomonas sp. gcc21]QJD59889.1 LysR family transcriptional regulator [Pseudomonas sp. gcc21]
MKKRHLPPLNPLRSFEAAARNGSFTKAAEELHVTTVAISRQVAVLEGYFGAPLFERLHQTLKLTHAGRALLPDATAAFDLLDKGTRKLRAPQTKPLRICAYPSVAVYWLIPRLPRFREAHPDIEISIATGQKPREFNYDEIDVGLQYLSDAREGLITQLLLPDIIQPACSPHLLKNSDPSPTEPNLADYTWIYSHYRRLDWEEWLNASGLEELEPVQKVTVRGSTLAYQAAVEGMGVAMVQRLLVEDEFKRGALVAPFKATGRRSAGICMVSRSERLDDPRIAAFRSWLEKEAGLTVDELASHSPHLFEPEFLDSNSNGGSMIPSTTTAVGPQAKTPI